MCLPPMLLHLAVCRADRGRGRVCVGGAAHQYLLLFAALGLRSSELRTYDSVPGTACVQSDVSHAATRPPAGPSREERPSPLLIACSSHSLQSVECARRLSQSERETDQRGLHMVYATYGTLLSGCAAAQLFSLSASTPLLTPLRSDIPVIQYILSLNSQLPTRHGADGPTIARRCSHAFRLSPQREVRDARAGRHASHGAAAQG